MSTARADEVRAVRFGLWWPDGVPDQLRHRATAWRRMAAALEQADHDLLHAGNVVTARCAGDPIDAFSDHQTKVLTAVDQTADACRQLADSLDAFADQVDDARARIIEMAAEIAASMVIGIGLAILTAGVSAGVAAEVTATMIARAGVLAEGLAGQAIAIASRVVVYGAVGAMEAGTTDLVVQVQHNARHNPNHDPFDGISTSQLELSAAGGFVLSGGFGGIVRPSAAAGPRLEFPLTPSGTATGIRALELPPVPIVRTYTAGGIERLIGVSADEVDEVAGAIGRGHAWEKHIIEQGEMPWIHSQDEFVEHIAQVMRDPTEVRTFARNRVGYWDGTTDAMVIFDPDHIDLGTAMVPDDGYAYFLRNVQPSKVK